MLLRGLLPGNLRARTLDALFPSFNRAAATALATSHSWTERIMTRLEKFLTWCSENNIWIDPRIRVMDDEITGLSVYSRETAAAANPIESQVTRESFIRWTFLSIPVPSLSPSYLLLPSESEREREKKTSPVTL